MKKMLNKFAEALLSKEQMKAVKGGGIYCNCYGQFVYREFPNGQSCAQICCSYSPGGGC